MGFKIFVIKNRTKKAPISEGQNCLSQFLESLLIDFIRTK